MGAEHEGGAFATELMVLSPEEIERLLRVCQTNINKGVRIVSDAEKAATDSARVYDRAYALAFLNYDGAQGEKRYAAEVDPAVIAARDDRDVKKLAFNHAKRVAEALESELRTLQSVNKSVIAMYGAPQGFGS